MEIEGNWPKNENENLSNKLRHQNRLCVCVGSMKCLRDTEQWIGYFKKIPNK
jgi:hypothetical protein